MTQDPGATIAQKIESEIENSFCHVCFFGKPNSVVFGEPLCEECRKNMYIISEDLSHIEKTPQHDFYLKQQRRKITAELRRALIQREQNEINDARQAANIGLEIAKKLY